MATAKRLLDAGELDSGGLTEMVEIQAIKKSKVNMQVDTTFIRGKTLLKRKVQRLRTGG